MYFQEPRGEIEIRFYFKKFSSKKDKNKWEWDKFEFDYYKSHRKFKFLIKKVRLFELRKRNIFQNTLFKYIGYG